VLGIGIISRACGSSDVFAA